MQRGFTQAHERPETETAEALDRIARVVRQGGVVIYPTETFYGLGGHPGLEAAVQKIYRIKGRDLGKPLPLIAADADAVRKVASAWPDAARRLAEAFWPGPLTLVLPVHAGVRCTACGSTGEALISTLVHAHTGKIAVRVSSHPTATKLASLVGGLLISTSANLAGEPPYTDPDGMPHSLLKAVDGLLHGGRLPGLSPSTIVDVSSGPPRLVRAGRLAWEAIQAALNR